MLARVGRNVRVMHRDVSRSLKGHCVLAARRRDDEAIVAIHLKNVVVEAFVAVGDGIACLKRLFPVKFVVLTGAGLAKAKIMGQFVFESHTFASYLSAQMSSPWPSSRRAGAARETARKANEARERRRVIFTGDCEVLITQKRTIQGLETGYCCAGLGLRLSIQDIRTQSAQPADYPRQAGMWRQGLQVSRRGQPVFVTQTRQIDGAK